MLVRVRSKGKKNFGFSSAGPLLDFGLPEEFMNKIFPTAFRLFRSDNRKSKTCTELGRSIEKRPRRLKWIGILTILVSLAGVVGLAQAQQTKVYRVGVITAGGAWYETIDGLRVGLRKLGLEEGKQFILAIRDTKGNAKAAEEAARNLEQEKVDLIYTTQTSVTIAAKRATADIPIVFTGGTDPVVLGLV